MPNFAQDIAVRRRTIRSFVSVFLNPFDQSVEHDYERFTGCYEKPQAVDTILHIAILAYRSSPSVPEPAPGGVLLLF